MSTVLNAGDRIPTFLDLMDSIKREPSLPEQRRKAIAAYLRGFCRVLDLDPATTPADLRPLQSRLERVVPRRLGFSRGHWCNTLAAVRSALRHVGVEGVPGRDRTPLTRCWSSLIERAEDRTIRDRVSRFARWCGARGIEPSQVQTGTFEDFRGALHCSVMAEKRVWGTWRELVRAWNRAAATIEGWPQVTVEVPSRSNRWTPNFDAFPAGLQKEVASWFLQAERLDLFAEPGPVRPLRPASITARRYALRAFLGALLETGRRPQDFQKLADVVEPETVKAGLLYLVARSNGDLLRAYKVACQVNILARDFLGVHPDQAKQLQEICRRLVPRQTGLTPKNRTRLRPFDDERNVRAILTLPMRLMKRARESDSGRRRDAILPQTAVALELLLMTSLRRGNLVRLNLDEHLTWTRPGRRGVLHLVIPDHETKNREILEFELPRDTSDLVRTYLEIFWPRLANGPSRWLFPGRDPGQPKDGGSLRLQVTKATLEWTGLTINPHLYRHLGAKLYLDRNPGGYEIVRRVLGQRNMATTLNFYVGAETAAALRHYGQTILKVRAASPGAIR